MVIGVTHIQPIVSLIAGVLILVMPRLLNYIVAIFLIISGYSASACCTEARGGSIRARHSASTASVSATSALALSTATASASSPASISLARASAASR